MRAGIRKVLVTGGAGFIGSAFVRLALSKGCRIVVVDKLTYAGDLRRLCKARECVRFHRVDICHPEPVGKIFAQERPDVVVNFAAETHVDRSIQNSRAFIETNVLGTEVLLSAARKYAVRRFLHISTDEVYGDIAKGKFSETSPFKPSSPYSAAKAAADLLLKSYIRTYDFPGIILRPSNNYGPWQYPEKLIPLVVLKALKGERVPVYAKGENVREWLYVEDCAQAILKTMERGKLGEAYNLGSSQEKQNIEVVKAILKILGKNEKLIQFVKDRPGHDIRYRLDSRKLCWDTGWEPETGFQQGLEKTVQWCVENQKWIFSKANQVSRLYKKR